MDNVLLLKAPSQDINDRYENTFNSAGFHVVSVTPLQTVFTNLDELQYIIAEGPATGSYKGVVITSGRGCEAWRSAVSALQAFQSSEGDKDISYWSSVPFYVVGEATAILMENVRTEFGWQSPYVPQDIRGKETGSGEELAHFIKTHLESRPAKLLYLTGDKNREIIPTILKGGGMSLDILKVYETQGSSRFEDELETAIQSTTMRFADRTSDPGKWWIVYFAPSSASFVTPILRKHFNLRAVDSSLPMPTVTSPRVAAIGPTTLAHLSDALKIHVDAVSSKPTPEDLLAAISGYDDNKDTCLRCH